MNKTIIKNVCLIMALFTALVNYVGATIDQSNDKCSVFSEVSENAEPKKLGYGEPRVVAVSPNGTKIALATGIGLWLFDSETLKPLYMLTDSSLGSVTDVGWLSDNVQVVAGYSDGTVKLWDIAKRELIHQIDTHEDGNVRVATSAENMLFAIGSFHKIQIWDATNIQMVSEIEYATGWVQNLSWSSNSRQIVTGTNNSSRIQIWDTTTGLEIDALESNALGGVNSLAWSPHNNYIAIGNLDSSPIWIWNFESDQIFKLSEHETNVISSLAWSPDGVYLASGDNIATIRIWNTASDQEISELIGHTGTIISIAWLPEYRLISVSKDGSVRIWDAIKGQELIHVTGYWGKVFSTSWSSDNTRLAVGYESGAQIWNINQNDVITLIDFPSHIMWDVEWSPNQQNLATGSFDLKLWNVGEDHPQVLNVFDNQSEIYAISWSPDGTRLAFGGQDNLIRIFNVDDWRELYVLEANAGLVSLAWSPDGTRLASGSRDNMIKVWNVTTGDLVSSFTAQDQWPPLSISWSQDNKFLVSTEKENILVWDTAKGQVLHRLNASPVNVVALAWSPQVSCLASGNEDGTIQIWDTNPWEKVTTLTGHTERITDLNWSPNGLALASASEDGTIRLWGIPSD